MRILFLLVLLVVVSPAYAQDGAALCGALANYTMPEGVELEGTLSSGSFDVVNIPITIDLAQAFGVVVPTGAELKPEVASMEIHSDGRVFYNGQELTVQASDLCAKSRVTYSRGQGAGDAVESLPVEAE